MRMWMLPPHLLCRQHLLGEHNECHSLRNSVEVDRQRYSLEGLAIAGLIEIPRLAERHEALVDEMLARGYRHQSPLDQPKTPSWWSPYWSVSLWESSFDLRLRCVECKERILADGSVFLPTRK